MTKPYHINTELFPGQSGELKSPDYLVIFSDSIEFDGTNYKIESLTTSPFDTKDDLLRYFSCKHDFLSSSENISGELIHYQMDESIPRIGEDIIYIYFNDGGDHEQYIYVDDGLYRFFNSPNFFGADVVILEQTEEEEVIVKVSHNVDSTALVYYVEEPEFELVQEVVLDQDAYYLLEEVPATYASDVEVVIQEYSDCPTAQFDTIYEQILVKEGRTIYNITPALIETVSELRLVQNQFAGELFYERTKLDSFAVTVMSSYQEVQGFDVSPGCDPFDFYQCSSITLVTVPKQDSILYDVYENCLDGYTSAGKYCYNNSGFSPAIFEIREYEKLIEPAFVTEVVIPNEYQTIQTIQIANKEDLNESCIDFVLDSISIQILDTPATVKETMVPAVYDTVEYKLYQDGGEIEVVSGEEDVISEISTIKRASYELMQDSESIITEPKVCDYNSIEQKLIELGYLQEDDLGDVIAFQKAVLAIQLENNLPLGVIDSGFVDLLDIKFGY